MTRWGFDRKACAKRRPYPLIRPFRLVVKQVMHAKRAPAPRPAKIPAMAIPSGMESLAASWAKGARA